MPDFRNIFDRSPEKSRIIDDIIRSVRPSKRPPLFDFSPRADDDQGEFIDCNSDYIRLLAPAGSGKTQSIVNRVVKQLSRGDRAPSSYLILTFDKAGANSLREKFKSTLEDTPLTEEPPVRTLNSFGYGLFKTVLADQFGTLEKGPDSDESTAVGNALTQLKHDNKAAFDLLPRNLARRVYLDFASQMKNNLIHPHALQEGDPNTLDLFATVCGERRLLAPWLEPNIRDDDSYERKYAVADQISTSLAWIYCTYCDNLWKHNRIDFDDQKLLPYTAFAKSPELAQSATEGIRVVIVDEFQDINRLDFELIKVIAQGKQLIVVGDDDQAIYAFRGCSPDYIINFPEIVLNAFNRTVDTHILTVNYRCPRNVVAMANKLISHNTRRVKKDQIAASKHDADVKVWHTVNATTEAQIISRLIKSLHEGKKAGLPLGDIAVLYRMNSQSLPLQVALIQEGLPYHCRKEDNVIISDTMKKLLRLINLHLKLQDDPGYSSVAATNLLADCCFTYVSPDARRRFHFLVQNSSGYRQAAQRTKIEPFSWGWFRSAVDALYMSGSTQSIVRAISANFRNLGGIVGSLEEAVDNFLPLGELVDIAAGFEGSIEEFHQKLSDLVEKAEGGYFAAKEGEGVNLLTYFRSKGRQWHTVILPGLNQGVIPHGKSEIEDERRLFYVAVTRASSNLVLSYVQNAVGSRVNGSQFISELGLSEAAEGVLLEWVTESSHARRVAEPGQTDPFEPDDVPF